MSLIAAAGLTAFALCLIATPLVRNLSSWAKLLDYPDQKRKLHRRAMPRLGGVAIAVSYVGALVLILLVAPPGIAAAFVHGSLVRSLLPATGLVFLTGLIDDLITLRPWQKLFGQSLASALAVSLGVHSSVSHDSSWLGMGLCFLWLLVSANAFNLIDGLDGLATGLALLTALATLVAAVLDQNITLALLSISLIGCLLAFLRYNFHPATIFLGDCGSLTLGFMLGCFALSWNRHTGTALGAVAPFLALALPVLDVALAVGRRLVRNVPLSQGDRSHIHHKLFARSRTTRRAVLILYSVCCCTSIFALVLNYGQQRFQLVVLLLFCVLAWAGIRSLRYVEFTAVVRSLSRGSIATLVKQEVYLLELEIALAKADTAEAMWDVTCMTCEDLQLSSVRMQIQERSFDIMLRPEQKEMLWAMTVPLGPKGYLTITRINKFDDSHLLLSVLNLLQNSITEKDFFDEKHQVALSTFSYQGAA